MSLSPMIISFLLSHKMLIYVMLCICIYILVGKIGKQYIKKKYYLPYIHNDASHDSEYHTTYYQKLQSFDVIRFSLAAIWIWYIITTYNAGFFSVIAIAVWTIIIVFQSFILSFAVYIYILATYKVWQTIRIWSIVQWEIVAIKPLHMSISTRNNDGDHTGELVTIIHNKIWEQSITRIDLHQTSYTKCTIRIIYDRLMYTISFDEFVVWLSSYLDEILPKRNASTVWHYTSYIWVRYKLDYDLWDYTDKKQLIYIDIWCIVRLSRLAQTKKKIILYAISQQKSV